MGTIRVRAEEERILPLDPYLTAVKRSRNTIGIYCNLDKDGQDAWVLHRPGEKDTYTFESESQLLESVRNPYSGSLVAPWLQTRDLKDEFYQPIALSGWKCMVLQQIATDIGVLRGSEPQDELVTMGFVAHETRRDTDSPPRLTLHLLGGETSFHENLKSLTQHFRWGRESPEIPRVKPINTYLPLETFYEGLERKGAKFRANSDGSIGVWAGKWLLHPIEAYADLCEPDLAKDGSLYAGGEESRIRLGGLIGLSPKDAVVVTRASSGMTDYGAIAQARLALEAFIPGSEGRRRGTAERSADALADRVPLPGVRDAHIERQRSYARSGATRDA